MKGRAFLSLALCAILASGAAPLAAQVETSLHGAVETFHAAPFAKDRGLADSRTAFTGELLVQAGLLPGGSLA